MLYILYYCQIFSTNNIYFYIFIRVNRTSVMVPVATCIFRFDNNVHFEGVNSFAACILPLLAGEKQGPI